MPKVLTKLRVDEISAVDRAAGEGTRVVLYKRDDRKRRKVSATSIQPEPAFTRGFRQAAVCARPRIAAAPAVGCT